MIFAQISQPNATIYDEIILVPNAFTPNQDGINDAFHIFIKEGALVERFIIIDRFGVIVFETKDPSIGWDGTYKNVMLPQGSYYFMISYRIRGVQELHSKKGSFLLLN